MDHLSKPYVTPPGPLKGDAMLPPEGMEIRKVLLEMLVAMEELASCGWLPRLFCSTRYREAYAAVEDKRGELRALVSRSAKHRVALLGIVNAMPPDSESREILLGYTK